MDREGLAPAAFRTFQALSDMPQFDPYRLAGGQLVVDPHTDPIGIDASRAVAPLRAAGRYVSFRGLTPTVQVEGEMWIVREQAMAAIPGDELLYSAESLAGHRDALK